MTTIAAYPPNDIRSMFKGPNGSIKTPANIITELKSKESKESNKEKEDVSTPFGVTLNVFPTSDGNSCVERSSRIMRIPLD